MIYKDPCRIIRLEKDTNSNGLVSVFWCIIPIISLELPYLHHLSLLSSAVLLFPIHTRTHRGRVSGSANRGNHHVWHLTLMWLTFCPFIPLAPSAPGWPCGRKPWLMALYHYGIVNVTAGKYIQCLLSLLSLQGLRAHPSASVFEQRRSLPVTDSKDRAKRQKA